MKKLTAGFTLFIVLALSVVALTGCGSALKGEWELTSGDVILKELSEVPLGDMVDSSKQSPDAVLRFTSNSEVVIPVFVSSASSLWFRFDCKVSGDTIQVFDRQGNIILDATFVLEDNILTITDSSGQVGVLKRIE